MILKSFFFSLSLGRMFPLPLPKAQFLYKVRQETRQHYCCLAIHFSYPKGSDPHKFFSEKHLGFIPSFPFIFFLFPSAISLKNYVGTEKQGHSLFSAKIISTLFFFLTISTLFELKGLKVIQSSTLMVRSCTPIRVVKCLSYP